MSPRYLHFSVLIFCWLAATHAYAHPIAQHQLEELEKAISSTPNDPYNYIQRGEIYLERKEYENTRRDIQHALMLDQKSGKPELLLAKLERSLGNHAKAHHAIDRALSKSPRFVAARLLRASLYRDESQYNDSANELQTILQESESATPDVYLALDSDLQHAIESIDTRVAWLKRGTSRLGPLVVLVSQIVALESSRNNFNAALAAINSLPENVKSSPKWLVRKAELEHASGDVAQAKQTSVAAERSMLGYSPGRREALGFDDLLQRLKALQ